jgi:NDP-hexose-3-ketoreductase
MEQKKIRIGALGCSSIAAKAILPAVVGSANFELVAVGSRDSGKGGEFARKFDCDATTYDGLLENERIDAVYVSLPTGLHAEWGMKILQAGKHLLMEKTFATSLVDSEKIIDFASRHKLIAMESLQYLHHPVYQLALNAVSEGAIGVPLLIGACFGIPERPSSDIRNDASLGGGAILDTLIYPLSFCLGFCENDPVDLHIKCDVDEARGVDVRGFLQMDWPLLSAQIGYGFGFFYQNHFSVLGSKGRLSASRVFTSPKDFAGLITIETQNGKTELPVPAADHYAIMLEAFRSKILGEDDSGTNEGDQILRRMRIIDKVMKRSNGHR